MSKVICKRSALVSLADSVRSKADIDNNMTVSDIAVTLNGINGTYTISGDIVSSDLNNDNDNDNTLIVLNRADLVAIADAARSKCDINSQLTLGQIKTIIDGLSSASNLTVLLPDQSFAFEYNESLMNSHACVVMSPTPLYSLEVGETYYLKCNGQTFVSQAVPTDALGYPGGVAIGNYELMMGGDSGAPIAILAMQQSGYYIYSYILLERHVIKIVADNGTVLLDENPSLPFGRLINGFGFAYYDVTLLSVDRSYTVAWDKETYVVQSIDVNDYGFDGVFIGNIKFLTGNESDDNGIPFGILSSYEVIGDSAYTSYLVMKSEPDPMLIGIYK